MSLRKSPERTPALLAANRANAPKSIKPQGISRSRQRELLNGLRDGGRLARSLEVLDRAPLPVQLGFARLYASLHKAVAPEPSEMDLVLAAAAFVWRVKRRIENRVRTPQFRSQVAARNGRLPPPWRMPIERPGGKVTVTIWIRPGRPKQVAGAGAPGADAPGPFYVGLTIRREGRRPWQSSDGPLNSVASSHPPSLALSSGERAALGQSEAAPERSLGRSGVKSPDGNRNSSDKVTVDFVKRNKIALQAGMSKFMNSIQSYVRGLIGKSWGSR